MIQKSPISFLCRGTAVVTISVLSNSKNSNKGLLGWWWYNQPLCHEFCSGKNRNNIITGEEETVNPARNNNPWLNEKTRKRATTIVSQKGGCYYSKQRLDVSIVEPNWNRLGCFWEAGYSDNNDKMLMLVVFVQRYRRRFKDVCVQKNRCVGAIVV